MPDHNFGTGASDKPEHYGAVKSWQHSEISAAFQPAVWTEKDPVTGFLTYPKRNQGMQNSCTCYAKAKALAVDEISENGIWRELSPHSLYPYVVLPGGGANSIDVAKTAAKIGITLESLLPSDGLSEIDIQKDTGYMTDAKQVALVYKPQNFVECGATFDEIASIIDGYRRQGIQKAICVTVIGQNNGTWLSAFPKPPQTMDAASYWYHRVPVLDFGLIGGVKHLAFDNSWGTAPGNSGQQLLSLEYEPFIYGAIYTLNMPDNWQQTAPVVTPPKHQWNTPLAVGSSGPDVLALQVALQSVGMFPISSMVKPTGYFGGITRQSLETFQAAFAIPGTGIVDASTRAKLNSIFM